jgi:hypothetical protein
MAVTTNVWPKNTFIQKPESKSVGLFLFLKVCFTNTIGKQYTVGILVPGSIYGEISSISLNSIETLEETHVCTIHKEKLKHRAILWKTSLS